MTAVETRHDAHDRGIRLTVIFGATLFVVFAVLAVLLVRGPLLLLVLLVVLGLAALLAVRARARSTSTVLASLGAEPVAIGELPRLDSLLDGLSIVSGVQRPDVYVIETDTVNAVAVGHEPAAGSLVLTRGLLENLNRIQLEGVLAHMLSRLDTGEAALATVTAGTVGLPITFAERHLTAGRRLLGQILTPFAHIAAPLAARSLEAEQPAEGSLDLRADLAGTALTRFPPGLADALERLSHADSTIPNAPSIIAPLHLLPPFRSDEDSPIPAITRRLPSHLPTEERVELLREL